MKRYSTCFKLNSLDFIEIKAPHKQEDLFRYDEVDIVFQKKDGQKFVIYSSDFIIEALRRFESKLTKATNNCLELHPSIIPGSSSKDIGLLWNEDLHSKEYLPQEVNEKGKSYWVGKKYLLFSCNKSRITSWVYNTEGKIFLELTPQYQWHFDEPEKGEKFITYENFVENYKPLIINEITKEAAQNLLMWIQELRQIVEKNDSKYLSNSSYK